MKHYYRSWAWTKLHWRRTRSLLHYLRNSMWFRQPRQVRRLGKKHLPSLKAMPYFKRYSTVNVKTLPFYVKRVFGLNLPLREPEHSASLRSAKGVRSLFRFLTTVRKPAQFDIMTSHHDVPATVLAALGMDLDPATYSYGHDLLAADYRRDYTVASDWHGNTLITPDVKMVFSKKGAFYDDAATTLDDDPIDLAATQAPYRDSLGLFTRELSRFYQ